MYLVMKSWLLIPPTHVGWVAGGSDRWEGRLIKNRSGGSSIPFMGVGGGGTVGGKEG